MLVKLLECPVCKREFEYVVLGMRGINIQCATCNTSLPPEKYIVKSTRETDDKPTGNKEE